MIISRMLGPIIVLAVLVSTVLSTLGPAVGQEDPSRFPSKPITMVVIFGAGGPTDVPARKLASILEKEFNQAVVVENKLGGAGVVGLTAVARAKPDGYTIGTFSYSPTVVAPHVRSVPFDTTKDFSFVAQFAEYAQPFCVPKDSPWKSVKELLDYARQNPGIITYSTVGAGSGQHIFLEALARRENVKLTHVPFRGGAEGVSALLGGHVKAGLGAELATPAKAGECRPLAVLSEKRLASFPGVPTFAELGYKIDPPLWLGVAGPAGIPEAIIRKLDAAIAKAMTDPSFLDTLEKFVLTPVFRGTEDFRKLVLRDFRREGDLIKELGLDRK
jgi:tripartite-type tricarboxylate transporter receptor subunit TctC